MLQILKYSIQKPKILIPMVLQHTTEHRKSKECCDKGAANLKKPPTSYTINRGPVCPEIDKFKGDKDDGGKGGLKRAKVPGKCRMGLIPEEWFQFLRPMTGVSGPYILMIGLANYAASKEILVMEHEYYLGISIFLVIYIVTTKFGSKVGSLLDKQVDAIANKLEDGRNQQLGVLKKHIADAELGIWRAEGQKELMDAKKENIKIQLEAVFRERQMMVHRGVLRRMEYHVKRHWVRRRIRHKWMVQWILEHVHKGITPEFKKHVMEIAIRDLTLLADKYQAGKAGGKK
ncbi:hypothetical protein PYW08_000359 [Mythimna loreyi]|uniref:Uncharacterized protein n=1 Tax=Mythimna loreyi TaxID=667449 RepID=A0ACC2RC91_9NEOP|nr:hypothetical protein PYW08_000359 [Mythimna loreyi]